MSVGSVRSFCFGFCVLGTFLLLLAFPILFLGSLSFFLRSATLPSFSRSLVWSRFLSFLVVVVVASRSFRFGSFLVLSLLLPFLSLPVPPPCFAHTVERSTIIASCSLYLRPLDRLFFLFFPFLYDVSSRFSRSPRSFLFGTLFFACFAGGIRSYGSERER